MKNIFLFTIGFNICLSLSSQSISATFTSGDINTSFNVYDPNCNGPLTTIEIEPITSGQDFVVDSVRIIYSMTADSTGFMSDQRSYIHCQNTSLSESQIFFGVGNSPGTFNYSRTDTDIANSLFNAGTILIFEMRAWRTFAASTNCNSLFNKVDNNTWTITVYYHTVCPISPVTLSDQMDVDLFVSNHSTCHVINQELWIESNVVDISGLSFIDSLNNRLTINNSQLKDLIGLENLRFVETFFIENNSLLQSTNQVNNLHVSDQLSILSNPLLENLPQINTGPTQFIEIVSNEILDDFSGMDSIIFIEDLDIIGNFGYSSFNGFKNLRQLRNLEISLNEKMDSLLGFENLEFATNILISFNDSLKFISSFQNLSVVNSFSITNNSNLQNIEWNENPIVYRNITLINNSRLSNCCIPFNLFPQKFQNINLGTNGPDCSSLFEIKNYCSSFDPDRDGVLTSNDNCPNLYNPNQEDLDSDGVGNACDNCPLVHNPDQADANNNFIGTACESPEPGPIGSQFETNELFINNLQKGIIMKNVNGDCYRLYVDLEGNLSTIQIDCPN